MYRTVPEWGGWTIPYVPVGGTNQLLKRKLVDTYKSINRFIHSPRRGGRFTSGIISWRGGWCDINYLFINRMIMWARRGRRYDDDMVGYRIEQRLQEWCHCILSFLSNNGLGCRGIVGQQPELLEAAMPARWDGRSRNEGVSPSFDRASVGIGCSRVARLIEESQAVRFVYSK